MSNLQITVRCIEDTPTLQDHIHKHFEKLKKHFLKINHCKVVIDLSQKHTNKAKIYRVSIDLTTPGKEFSSGKLNENLFVAIRDSFAAMEKSLAKHYARNSSSTKRHHAKPLDLMLHPE